MTDFRKPSMVSGSSWRLQDIEMKSTAYTEYVGKQAKTVTASGPGDTSCSVGLDILEGRQICPVTVGPCNSRLTMLRYLAHSTLNIKSGLQLQLVNLAILH